VPWRRLRGYAGGVFLNDAELLAELEGSKPFVTGLQLGDGPARFSKEATVQPCSVDLNIGDIFIPGTSAGEPGSSGFPLEGTVLKPGGTAVVTTLERCQLPPRIGAIGFPPNSVSSQGILTTNPGHVDPGYEGTMTFTVINMGQKDYTLLRGEKIVTLLFFRLDEPAVSDLKARGATSTSNIDRMLAVLSSDFLGISARVKAAASEEEQKTRRAEIRGQIWLGVFAIAATIVAAIVASGIYLNGEIHDVKAQAAAYGDFRKLERKINDLERKLNSTGPSEFLRTDPR
jgi:dCTP deaminase